MAASLLMAESLVVVVAKRTVLPVYLEVEADGTAEAADIIAMALKVQVATHIQFIKMKLLNLPMPEMDR